MSTRFASAERYGNVDEVRAAYPGAAKIIEVEGGWMVFSTEDAFQVWSRQR